jgi:hypothetical protein
MSDDLNTDPTGHGPERVPHTGGNGSQPPGGNVTAQGADEPPRGTPIAKPDPGKMARFLSKRGANAAGVETLQTALPHYKLPDAKDFSRLFPDEEIGWSGELCFVPIPIKGIRRDLLHLIDEDLVPPDAAKQIQRFRLALATKPFDVFYLCHVPTQNLDNSYNASNLRACERAKQQWVKAIIDKEDESEEYKMSFARDEDAFPKPRWPKQTIYELIDVTFGKDRCIDHENHPALLRLIGARQSMK